MELVKNSKYIKTIKILFIALLATVFLAISSKIKIPFYPVPMTMQTFVVLFIGVFLGWKMGLFAITLYLFEGIIGLPVFSGTPEKGIGLIYFTGPTMGYLIGFLPAVFLSGYYNYNNNFLLNFIKLMSSVSLIYIFGLIWLGSILGWDKPIFDLGAKPFLLAELFKILLLSVLLVKFKNYRKLS